VLWGELPIAFALADRLARLRGQTSTVSVALTSDAIRKWAAVAVIAAPDPDAILLIRRSERTGDPWSGHIALPGGRHDPADRDLLETAVRETREEVGVQLGREHLIASLEPVIPRTRTLPPIAIRPFVFLLPSRPSLSLNSEVAAAAWVEVEHLLRPASHGQVELEIAGDIRVVDAYKIDHGVVWGITERILTALLQDLR
jgi:8-oxo-dGTP pyrophosphatase MutT (NUDIX family)